jgi:hypothetical protein
MGIEPMTLLWLSEVFPLNYSRRNMPAGGFEPPTCRLRGACSAVELCRHKPAIRIELILLPYQRRVLPLNYAGANAIESNRTIDLLFFRQAL